MKQGLFQQQQLNLNVTQDLVQAINLLQLSSLELAAYIENMATENPLLEIEINVSTFDPQAYRKKSDQTAAAEHLLASSHSNSLYNYLQGQIFTLPLTDNEKRLLKYLIHCINESGYLEADIIHAAKLYNLSEEIGLKVLKTLQSLDPPGIGARNLQECILLQLERMADVDPDFFVIIKEHFLDFAQKRWKPITSARNIPLYKLQELLDIVRLCNPRPGLGWVKGFPEHVVPDIIVTKRNDTWEIRLFEEGLFTVKMNEEYYGELKVHSDPEIKKYIKEKKNQVNWLVKSMQHRRMTIIQMMSSIIERQRSFFQNLENDFKPMTMKQIAEDIRVHESTISRIAQNKYVKIEGKTFLLKDLFSVQLPNTNNEESISNRKVKSAIGNLIMTENKNKPFSDQEIAELLKKQGIIVARRTVAKYREQLNIPSSSIRKRYD